MFPRALFFSGRAGEQKEKGLICQRPPYPLLSRLDVHVYIYIRQSGKVSDLPAPTLLVVESGVN